MKLDKVANQVLVDRCYILVFVKHNNILENQAAGMSVQLKQQIQQISEKKTSCSHQIAILDDLPDKRTFVCASFPNCVQ